MGLCLDNQVETTLRIEKDRLLIEKLNFDTMTVPYGALTELNASAAPEGARYKWMLRIHWILWGSEGRGIANRCQTFNFLCDNAHNICTHATMSKSCDDVGLNKPSVWPSWNLDSFERRD